MKKINFLLLCILASFSLTSFAQKEKDAIYILDEIDELTEGKSSITKSKIIVHGERATRTMELINYSTDTPKRSYTEYSAPARDKGTKMLKLGPQLWVYSPSNDRITAISGHLLRQSIMGTDLSYEDIMDDRDLSERYSAKEIKTEEIDGNLCHVYELTAKAKDVTYPKQIMWADLNRKVFLKVEMYSKSDKLLKVATFSDFEKANGHWKSKKIHFKDMQKRGDGSDMIILDFKLNVPIADDVFNKSKLKK